MPQYALGSTLLSFVVSAVAMAISLDNVIIIILQMACPQTPLQKLAVRPLVDVVSYSGQIFICRLNLHSEGL